MDEHIDAAPPEWETPAEIPTPIPSPVDPLQPPPNPYTKKDDEPKKMSKSEKIMVWATCVIAAGTLMSFGAIRLQWKEMVKGSEDTTAIREAAQKQADAAQMFADTASLINGNINDAVAKLDAQARATQKAADAAHLSAEGLRPRLAIILLTPVQSVANGLPMSDGRLQVAFQTPNYGPSAAQGV
jgi:hypothetical protein